MDTQLAKAIAAESSPARSGIALGSQGTSRRSVLVQHAKPSVERSYVEQFIAREYKAHFDADVSEFMPILAGLYDEREGLKAAVGYRAASSGSLFLEAYTNAPIEDMIRAQTGLAVARKEIVEVGSLACRGGRAAMEIVMALAPALIEAGFTWVVFTGADTVRNVFRRMHLKPVALCIANKSMLGEQQTQWGTYYDHNPVVMAGRLADGIVALEPVGAIC